MKIIFKISFCAAYMGLASSSLWADLLDDFKQDKKLNAALTPNTFVISKVNALYNKVMKEATDDIDPYYDVMEPANELLKVFFFASPFKPGKVASQEIQKQMYRSLFQLAQINRKYQGSEISPSLVNDGRDVTDENTPLDKHRNIASLFMMIVHGANQKDDLGTTDLSYAENDFLEELKLAKNKKENLIDPNRGILKQSIGKYKKQFGFSLDKNYLKSFNKFWKNEPEGEKYISNMFKYLNDFYQEFSAEELKPAKKNSSKQEKDPLEVIKNILERETTYTGESYAQLLSAWKKNPQGFLQKVREDLLTVKDIPEFSARAGKHYSLHTTLLNLAHTVYSLLKDYDGKKLWDYLGEKDYGNPKYLEDYPFSKILKLLNDYQKSNSKEFISTIQLEPGAIEQRKQQIEKYGLDKTKEFLKNHYEETYFSLIVQSYLFAQATGNFDDFLKTGLNKDLLCTGEMPTKINAWAQDKAQLLRAEKDEEHQVDILKENYEMMAADLALTDNKFLHGNIDSVIKAWLISYIGQENHLSGDMLSLNLEDLAIKEGSKKDFWFWSNKAKEFSNDTYKIIKEAYEKQVLPVIPDHQAKKLNFHNDEYRDHRAYQFVNRPDQIRYYETEHLDKIVVYRIEKGEDNRKVFTILKIHANSPDKGTDYMDNVGYKLQNVYLLNNLYNNNYDVLSLYFKERFVNKIKIR